MRPVRLRARNLRTWRELELEVPAGITAVVGPNGAGKSTLVHAIDLALFGDGRELKRAHTREAADSKVVIELELEHAGELYRIRRGYDVAGRGRPSLDLERENFAAREWYSLTRETVSETQALIEETLGLSRQTFRASSYLAQGDGAAFTMADPRERKAILLDALGVRVWDRLRELAGERRQTAEFELSRLVTTIELLEGQVSQRDAVIAALRAAELRRGELELDVKDREAGYEALRNEAADALALDSSRAGREARVREAELAARSAASRVSDLELAEKSDARAGDELVELLAGVERELEKVQTCPTCKRPLEGESLEHARKAMRARRSELEVRQSNLMAAAAERRERLSEAHGEASVTKAALADAKTALAELEGQRDPRELLERSEKARRELEAKRAELRTADESVARAGAALAAIEARRGEKAELERRRELWVADAELLKLAERAYGRDGVPALILEAHAIPHLELEANRILTELGRDYRLELRTQRDTASGTVREVLDIIVITESGPALYEDFSGGERTRLDLSLRIALARLLVARRGSDVRLLAIDEPAYLDDEGFERLAGVLRELASDFDSVLVVSHVEALRDAFDSAIIVEGGADTGEPSRLAAREGVNV